MIPFKNKILSRHPLLQYQINNVKTYLNTIKATESTVRNFKVLKDLRLPVQQRKAMGQILDLPENILINIICKLKPLDVAKMRLVCKLLLKIIDDFPQKFLDKINLNGDKSFTLKKTAAPGLKLLPRLSLRESAAHSHWLPAEVYRTLATDVDDDVRGDVAENPTTPEDSLRILAIDCNKYVAYSVLANPNLRTQLNRLRSELGDQIKPTWKIDGKFLVLFSQGMNYRDIQRHILNTDRLITEFNLANKDQFTLKLKKMS